VAQPGLKLYAHCASPLGELLLVADGEQLTGLYFDAQKYRPAQAAEWRHAPTLAVLGETRRQLAEYFARERRRFELPLAPAGSPFQRRVWTALCAIPYGETTSYGALAAGLGHPRAARAVGAANGRNPLGIVVPCHRVVGGGGRLTGYAAGLERKAALLALERGAGAEAAG
jgi:methylated-DNA-[protein]-cysteine S-methyltransferase